MVKKKKKKKTHWKLRYMTEICYLLFHANKCRNIASKEHKKFGPSCQELLSGRQRFLNSEIITPTFRGVILYKLALGNKTYILYSSNSQWHFKVFLRFFSKHMAVSNHILPLFIMTHKTENDSTLYTLPLTNFKQR